MGKYEYKFSDEFDGDDEFEEMLERGLPLNAGVTVINEEGVASAFNGMPVHGMIAFLNAALGQWGLVEPQIDKDTAAYRLHDSLFSMVGLVMELHLEADEDEEAEKILKDMNGASVN